MTVCVTGGSGFIGRLLVTRLLSEGHDVKVLSRFDSNPVLNGTKIFTGDLASTGCSLDEFLENSDVIFHCAGETVNEEKMELLHIKGTERLINAATEESYRSGKKIHFVLLSSVGVYGPPLFPDQDRLIVEHTPFNPVGKYEVTKAVSDNLIQNIGNSPFLTWTILRPSNVFGPEMKNKSLIELSSVLRKGLFFFIGSKDSIATYVHVDDVVSALLVCGFNANSKNQIFNLSNDCFFEEMVSGLASSLSVSIPRLRIPKGIVYLVIDLANILLRLPLTRKRVSAMISRTRYPYEKIFETLHFKPKYSVPETISCILENSSLKTNGKKKICIIATVPFALNFFMRPHILKLSKTYEVTLLSNGKVEDFLFPLSKNIRFVPINIYRKISVLRDFHILYTLTKLMFFEKFDVVHTLTPKAGLVGMLAAFMSGVKIRIHTFTGQIWVNKSGFGRKFLIFFDKLVSQLATNVMADSYSQSELLKQNGISKNGKIEVLGFGSMCGVDLGRFLPSVEKRVEIRRSLNIPLNAKVILFLGRLNKDKGVLDLARAYLNILEVIPNVHLVLVGPNDGLEPELRQILKSAKSSTHFVGYTTAPEDFMASSDVLSLPSYREGFGSVVIEAAACGVPAAASNICGLVDAVVDGVTGALHKKGDIQSITEVLIKLLTNEDLRSEMARKAKARVEKEFSRELLEEQMELYYKKILS